MTSSQMSRMPYLRQMASTRGPIVGGRDDDAAGALDRLADEGGDIFGTDFEDALLHRLGGAGGEGGGILAEALAEGIGLHDVLDARHPGSALIMHGLHAAQAGAGDGRAVVAVDPGDDDVAVGDALHLPVIAGQADDGVDGFRAGVVEEDVLQITAQQLGDLGRQHDRGGRGGLEEGVVVGQLQHLVIGGGGQFLAAIADLDAPQARHAVKNDVPIAIVDETALRAGDDAAAAQVALQPVVGLGRQVVGHIEATKFGDIVVAQGHGRGP